MTFNDLQLIDPILRAVQDKNYTTPTKIQEKAIPIILQRKDVMGCAQTGTGKTAAFSIPILQLIQRIEKENAPTTLRALILTPTRELAIQINDSINDYGKYTHVRHTVIFGGVKQHKQVKALEKGVHILVATPGRLLDLMSQGYIDLSTIKMFVLDEADRMLDMGFIHDIRKVLKALPQSRQSLFFSATMAPEIKKLANQILKAPKMIEVTPTSSTAEKVEQHIYYTNRLLKKQLLLHLLEENIDEQALLFARTKRGADRITRDLKKKKIRAVAIHGDKQQNQRQKALNKFKAGEIDILVATDIAARGIDIEKLKYVINYDIPNEAETYVHRIGRSGRAGEEGLAISLCEPEENAYVKDIEKLINQKIEVIDDHPYPQTDKPMTAAEKKEWNKEKEKRKQAFIAAKRNRRNNPSRR